MSDPFEAVDNIDLDAQSLYAWVTTTHDGRKTLVGVMISGRHTPLISHDRAQVERLRPLAFGHSLATQQPLELMRFQRGEVLEHHKAIGA